MATNQNTDNRITGPYSAVCGGKSGALAGCDNTSCPKRSRCLRSSRELASRYVQSLRDDGSCPVFIQGAGAT